MMKHIFSLALLLLAWTAVAEDDPKIPQEELAKLNELPLPTEIPKHIKKFNIREIRQNLEPNTVYPILKDHRDGMFATDSVEDLKNTGNAALWRRRYGGGHGYWRPGYGWWSPGVGVGVGAGLIAGALCC